MDSNNSTHKIILKSTSIFGFAQLIKLVFSITGSKIAAIYLGPIGMGVLGIIQSLIQLIASISSFGFLTIATRELTISKNEPKNVYLEKQYLFYKLSIYFGLLAAFISILFSPVLSYFTFGNTKNWYWFVFLSIYFFFQSLSNFELAKLQSVRNSKLLAKSSSVISIFSVMLSSILYVLFKEKAIVFVLLFQSILNYLVLFNCSKKNTFINLKMSFWEVLQKSKATIQLGFLLSLNIIFGIICTYLIKLFLKYQTNSLEIVGLYEVGTVLLIAYVGLLFNSMSMDFFPRLTEKITNTFETNKIVNEQIEIGLVIITPLILFFYSFLNEIITLLYSVKFLQVVLFLQFGLISVLIKAIIWPLAFVILAKGNKNLYFKQEILGDFLNVFFSILFYIYFGLQGLGFAIILGFSIYGLYVYYILKNKFNFLFSKNVIKLIFCSLSIGLLASFFSIKITNNKFQILISLFLISLFFSVYQLNKLIPISEIIQKIKNKF